MDRSIDLFNIFVRKGAIEDAPIFNILGGIPSGPNVFFNIDLCKSGGLLLGAGNITSNEYLMLTWL